MSEQNKYEQPGKGSLLPNNYRKSDTQPTHKGYLIMDMDYKAGTKVEIAGWEKETRIGKVVQLRISKKMADVKQYPVEKKAAWDDGNDVPF